MQSSTAKLRSPETQRCRRNGEFSATAIQLRAESAEIREHAGHLAYRRSCSSQPFRVSPRLSKVESPSIGRSLLPGEQLIWRDTHVRRISSAHRSPFQTKDAYCITFSRLGRGPVRRRRTSKNAGSSAVLQRERRLKSRR